MSQIDMPEQCINVGIGQWKVVQAPVGLRAILGSCVGVALYDRLGKVGGLAHILLPNSRGAKDFAGRYADTAIPAMIEEFCRLRGAGIRSSLVARIAGGASMFETTSTLAIGESNHSAVIRILGEMKITVMASDIGGELGRNLTFDTRNGKIFVKKTGGQLYEL
ncbi:MAG: chemotaxis protein CheD [bacterium]